MIEQPTVSIIAVKKFFEIFHRIIFQSAEGYGVKPASKAVYIPLLDMVPSDPSTTGQVYTVFTADQQLYRIMVGVMWVYPELFINSFLDLVDASFDEFCWSRRLVGGQQWS